MAIIKHNLPWIESPFFERELAGSDLSETNKAFVKEFAENGYVILDAGIEASTIEAIKKELAADFKDITGKVAAGKLPPQTLNRIQDAWQYNENVRAVASSPLIMDRLRLLYRREPFPFQTLNFNVGTQQRTHSDMIHFSSIPERFMCGVWIAFEDITEDNGPLHYYPKSHKLPFYEMSDMNVKGSESRKMKNGYMDYSDYYENFIEAVATDLKLEKKKLLIKKGQALIWAANLLHGGEQINQPGATRHSQVTHYYFQDCLYYTPLYSDIAIKEMYIRDVVNAATGAPVKNKYLGDEIKINASTIWKRRLGKMLPKSIMSFYHSLIRK